MAGVETEVVGRWVGGKEEAGDSSLTRLRMETPIPQISDAWEGQGLVCALHCPALEMSVA